jgi:hypothetical protein
LSRVKKIILIAANVLCILLLIVAALISAHFSGLLRSQHIAAEWRGNNQIRFSQISALIPKVSAISYESIRSFRTTIDDRLTEASLEAPETGKLWTDAFSVTGNITVSSPRASASTPALGVGGDYFLFHPHFLLSGSYISESDLMNDRVVLDEELAWKLFGGTDVAGMEVTINDKLFYIAGVVSREKDFASVKGGSEGSMIFMSYDVLISLSSTEEQSAGITHYEAILPNVITGYAKQLVSENFPTKDCEIVENTGRFGFERRFSVMADFGERSMRVNGVIYPYWENAARYIEDWLALILVASMLVSLCPIATAIWLVVKLKKYGDSKRDVIKAAIEKRTDKITQVRYDKRQEKQRERERAEKAEYVDDFNIDSIVSEVLKENKSDSNDSE